MKTFVKYQSVRQPHKWLGEQRKRFLNGNMYVFPKLDGANASVWADSEGDLRIGSRNRDLGDEGFRGFREFVFERESQFKLILGRFKDLTGKPCTIYGEWLVPHSVNTYTDEMWNKFWIFDVVFSNDDNELEYVSYEDQQKIISVKESYPYLIPFLEQFPFGINEEDLENLPGLNKFGIKPDSGFGEGVVIKRYDSLPQNESWMKVIHKDFKNGFSGKKTHVPLDTAMEEQIVAFYMTSSDVEKEYNKLMDENCEMPRGMIIPRLLQSVFHSFIEDYLWAALKKYKNPSINFRALQSIINRMVREYKPELF